VNCGLTVQIEFSGPPAINSIFEFNSGGDEGITSFGSSGDALGSDFQISRLFQLVRVGDEVGLLTVQQGGPATEGGIEGQHCRPGHGPEKETFHNLEPLDRIGRSVPE